MFVGLVIIQEMKASVRSSSKGPKEADHYPTSLHQKLYDTTGIERTMMHVLPLLYQFNSIMMPTTTNL